MRAHISVCNAFGKLRVDLPRMPMYVSRGVGQSVIKYLPNPELPTRPRRPHCHDDRDTGY